MTGITTSAVDALAAGLRRAGPAGLPTRQCALVLDPKRRDIAAAVALLDRLVDQGVLVRLGGLGRNLSLAQRTGEER